MSLWFLLALVNSSVFLLTTKGDKRQKQKSSKSLLLFPFSRMYPTPPITFSFCYARPLLWNSPILASWLKRSPNTLLQL